MCFCVCVYLSLSLPSFFSIIFYLSRTDYSAWKEVEDRQIIVVPFERTRRNIIVREKKPQLRYK